jgi:hypothetical protein
VAGVRWACTRHAGDSGSVPSPLNPCVDGAGAVQQVAQGMRSDAIGMDCEAMADTITGRTSAS